MRIMKRLVSIISSLAVVLMLAVGCYPDVLVPDQNKLPSAESFDVDININQETNYVTFTMKNKGMVPMWIFGDVKIDKAQNQRYAYTQNGVTLRFREAGEHQVEVKAYNANGVSLGSKMMTFVLNNTYRDPFDPSPYLKAIDGEWIWNSTVDGHFGCGPDFNNPKSWWAAKANEKADWSLYNDKMKFTADGKYSFDPGEDGKVYVNKDFTGTGEGPQGEDYLISVPAYETTFEIENNWNSAGIEEIWLVLPAKKNLSYIPNNQIYDSPRFLFIESKPSKIKTELILAADNAPNGDGTISWYYNFVHPGKIITPEELLAGTDPAGKVWVMDKDVKGHIGCGWDVENAAGWWAAGPNEKEGWGMYDNELTFCPDGTFKFNSGPDGQIYVNKEVTVFGVVGATEDYCVDFANKNCKYQFDGANIVLESENTIGYVSSEAVWNTPDFIVTELTETKLVIVSFAKTVGNPDGIAWQYIFKARDVQPGPEPPKVIWADEDSPANLLNGGQLALASTWFANNDWGTLASQPTVTISGRNADVTVNEANGGQQWQGQVHLNTGVAIEEGKAYDFKIVLEPSQDIAGATVKPHPEGDDAHFFSEGRHDLSGYEENIITYENFLSDFSTANLVITLDFPSCAQGTEIKVKGIIIQNHNDGSVIWVSPDSPDNLVNGGTVALASTWFANNDWGTLASQPTVVVNGKDVAITVNEANGGQQWQGQVHLNTGIAIEEGKTYDFKIVLEPTQSIAGATVKPHPEGDDAHFFSEGRHDLAEYEENVITYVNFTADFSTANLVITLDFPSCAAGTEIKMSGFILQLHK